jgi:SdrD B-like domain
MTRGQSAARFARRMATPILILATIAGAVELSAQEPSSRALDIVVDRAVIVPMTAVSHTLVVDETVCRVEVAPGGLRILGLKRGETIVVAWHGDAPESLRVRVNAPEPRRAESRPTSAELDAMGHGTLGSLVHVSTSSSGSARSVSLLTPFAWTEGTPDRRFTVNGQIQGAQAIDASTFNLDTLSAQWIRGQSTFQLLDFIVDLDGGPAAHVAPVSPMGFALRGGSAVVSHGKNSYEAFVGSTLPMFAASRQLTGFSVARQSDERLRFDTTGAVVRAPVLVDGIAVAHQVSAFQTVGVTNRLNDRAAVQVRAGGGTKGAYGQGATAWQGRRFSAFVTASGSSPQFGLNQLQLVYAPSRTAQSGVSWNVVQRLRIGAGYSHNTTQATPLFPASSRSDYLSQTINLTLARHHTLFLNGTWNRNVGGLGAVGEQVGRRLDAGLSSQFGARAANSFYVSSGALADPLQFNSRGEFSVRENLTVAVRGGSINVSASHDRLSPSLVARLRQQVSLLAAGLQPLFLDDPVGFVQSPLMPADVRQLLNALEPVDTQIAVTGQLRLGPRLTLNPSLSYLHHAQSSSFATRNEMLGYSLTWRATPTLELQSTLANALIFDPRKTDLARTTIFGVGFRKTFNGAPRWIAPSSGYRIQGRVFRDLNMDGIADRAEPGLSNVAIRLHTGQTVHTSESGRFEFSGLSAGEYHLSMPLGPLGAGVRVTTPVDLVVRLYERRAIDQDFGVVNFSRLVGAVFNDTSLTGVRQAGAPGLRAIGVIIDGDGIERRSVTDTSGDFEIDDLPPGHYRISLDTATLPPNYEAETLFADVDVTPSSTTRVSLPVRALRSLGGRVYLRASGAGTPLVPLAGVKVAAHAAVAITDADGRFLLRNLPAGDVTVAVVPAVPLPDGLSSPIGRLRMPDGPLQIDSATIVIDNPRLIQYLTATPVAGSSPRR